MVDEEKRTNEALDASKKYNTVVEEANDYIEHFDILETITNVGNDEVFTPRKTCDMMLDSLPEEVWHNPLYKWLNPATKNGIFEREIALRLDKGLENVIKNKEERRKHILQNMIFSIGQTKFTSNVARRTLYYCSQANRKCDGLKASDGHYVNGFAIGNGSWFETEEGNIITPNVKHEIDSKTKKCRFCGIAYDSKYLDANQRETYAYEFIHHYHLVLERDLNIRFFGGNKKMKFDIIIGNPPYQLSDGGAQASARPIYHLFVNQAKVLNPKYLCMIIPSRWMVGGKGLDDFREAMLADTHIQLMHDYIDAKECFPSNDITGGVCYFVWNRDYDGKCKIVTHSNGTTKESIRFLKEKGSDIFIRDETLISILKKVKDNHSGKFADSVVSARKPYGLEAETTLNPTKYGLPPFSETEIKGGYKIYGLGERGRRSFFYIPNDYPIPKLSGCAKKYKVFIAEADGAAGQIGNPVPARIIGKPTIGEPFTICTETFLEIGPFDTEEEASCFANYIKTKFFRTLVGVVKQTQHTTQKVYQYVPLLSMKNDLIDWKKPISEIDKQLYKLFKLSNEEIEFIEAHIQEMF